MSVERLGSMAPVEVLYEFDGPLVFTTTASSGRKLLAYASFSVDEDSEQAGYTRYVIAPTSDKILDSLKKGTCTLYEALDQSMLWAADIAYSGAVVRLAELGQLSDVPSTCLPARNRHIFYA
jgi:DNA-binding beta-propeller fold protein YncE